MRRDDGKQATDAIELSIFSTLVSAVVEEACGVLARTAYTTFVKEIEDFSVALAKPDGTYFAYPGRSGVPTAVALPAESVIAGISEWAPGDILFVNDPYTSGGMVTHSPDITMIAPIFHQGELIAFCWAFLHSSDIGGAVPGSLDASLTDVYQEGLRIPPAKLYRGGQLNEDIYKIIKANVRVPYQLWGDVQAIVSAFRTASERLIEIFERYGVARAKSLIDECIDYGEAKSRAVIAEIPDGVYRFKDYLDDDISSPFPVRICLSIEKQGTEIHLDFTGTDPQVLAAINLATAGHKHHTWVTTGVVQYLLTSDRKMPVNSGILRPIRVTAPAGTLVHAVPPASLGGRLVSGIRVMDIIFGALLQAIPDRVPAAGSGQGIMPVYSTPDLSDGSRKVNMLQPLVGGTGARPTCDGYDGTNYSLSFMKNTPVEIIETELDLYVHRYYFVPDSGGAGRFRGGLGVGLSAEATKPDTTIALRGVERTRFAPWGAMGGHCGRRTQPVVVNRGKPHETTYRKRISLIRLAPGDVVEFQTSGGGGFGDPLDRDLAKVERDCRYGYVSRAVAEELYGLVFTSPESMEVDADASSIKRSEARAAAGEGAVPIFGFCEVRKEYEAVWTDEAYDELQNVYATLSIHARVYAKGAIMARVNTGRNGSPEPITAAEIRKGWALAKADLGLATPTSDSSGTSLAQLHQL
ncbi:MAG TPA: hydantoinase B/oxoprolinase family protein [Rhizobiaceae bacterium]|nr:hydantoinase B/oxoprolinase family protein [Rhizobiaceae bacterium]